MRGLSGKALAGFWARKGAETLADQILISGSNFLLTLTLARLLGPENYGAYALMFAVFLLVGNVQQALLIEPMGVFQPSSYPNRRRQYIGSVLWLHALVSGVFMAGMAVAAVTIWLIGMKPLAQAATGAVVAIPTVLLLWTARAASYLDFRPSRAVLGSVLYCVALLGAMVGVYKAGWLSPFSTFAMMGGAATVAGVFLIARLRPVLRPGAAPGVAELWRTHWNYGRWALLAVAVGWLELNGIYVLNGAFLGMREVGAMAALWTLHLPVTHTIQGSSRLLLPHFSKLYGERGAAGTRKLAGQVALAFAAATTLYGAAVSMFSASLLRTLFGDQYVPYAPYVAVSMIPLVLSAAILPAELALRAMQAPAQLLKVSAISSGVTVAIGAVALARYGFTGIFVTFSVSGIVHLALAVFLLRRETHNQTAAVEQAGGSMLAYQVQGEAGDA